MACSGLPGAFISGAAEQWKSTARSELMMARGFAFGSYDKVDSPKKDAEASSWFLEEMTLQDTSTIKFDSMSFFNKDFNATIQPFSYSSAGIMQELMLRYGYLKLYISYRLSDVLAMEFEEVYQGMGILHNEEPLPKILYTPAKCKHKIDSIVFNWRAQNAALLCNAPHFTNQFADAKIIGAGSSAMRCRLWFMEYDQGKKIFSNFYTTVFIQPETRQRDLDAELAVSQSMDLMKKVQELSSQVANLSRLQGTPSENSSKSPKTDGAPAESTLPRVDFSAISRANSDRVKHGRTLLWPAPSGSGNIELEWSKLLCIKCLDSGADSKNPFHNIASCTAAKHENAFLHSGSKIFDFHLKSVRRVMNDPNYQSMSDQDRACKYLDHHLGSTMPKTSGDRNSSIDDITVALAHDRSSMESVWEKGQDLDPLITKLPSLDQLRADYSISPLCFSSAHGQDVARLMLNFGLDSDLQPITVHARMGDEGDQAVGIHGKEIRRCNFAAIAKVFDISRDEYLQSTQTDAMSIIELLHDEDPVAAIALAEMFAYGSDDPFSSSILEALEDITARCQASTLRFLVFTWVIELLGSTPLVCIHCGTNVEIDVYYPSCSEISASVHVPVKLVAAHDGHMHSLVLTDQHGQDIPHPTLQQISDASHPWQHAADVRFVPCVTANLAKMGSSPVTHPDLPWTQALLNPSSGSFAPGDRPKKSSGRSSEAISSFIPAVSDSLTIILSHVSNRDITFQADHWISVFVNLCFAEDSSGEEYDLICELLRDGLPEYLPYRTPMAQRIADRLTFLAVTNLGMADSGDLEVYDLERALLTSQLHAFWSSVWGEISRSIRCCRLVSKEWLLTANLSGFPALGRRLRCLLSSEHEGCGEAVRLHAPIPSVYPLGLFRTVTPRMSLEDLLLFGEHVVSWSLNQSFNGDGARLFIEANIVRQHAWPHDVTTYLNYNWSSIAGAVAGNWRLSESISCWLTLSQVHSLPQDLDTPLSDSLLQGCWSSLLSRFEVISTALLLSNFQRKSLTSAKSDHVLSLFVEASRCDDLHLPSSPTWLDLYAAHRAICDGSAYIESNEQYEARHGLSNNEPGWWSAVKNRSRSRALCDAELVSFSSPGTDTASDSYSSDNAILALGLSPDYFLTNDSLASSPVPTRSIIVFPDVAQHLAFEAFSACCIENQCFVENCWKSLMLGPIQDMLQFVYDRPFLLRNIRPHFMVVAKAAKDVSSWLRLKCFAGFNAQAMHTVMLTVESRIREFYLKHFQQLTQYDYGMLCLVCSSFATELSRHTVSSAAALVAQPDFR